MPTYEEEYTRGQESALARKGYEEGYQESYGGGESSGFNWERFLGGVAEQGVQWLDRAILEDTAIRRQESLDRSKLDLYRSQADSGWRNEAGGVVTNDDIDQRGGTEGLMTGLAYSQKEAETAQENRLTSELESRRAELEFKGSAEAIAAEEAKAARELEYKLAEIEGLAGTDSAKEKIRLDFISKGMPASYQPAEGDSPAVLVEKRALREDYTAGREALFNRITKATDKALVLTEEEAILAIVSDIKSALADGSSSPQEILAASKTLPQEVQRSFANELNQNAMVGRGGVPVDIKKGNIPLDSELTKREEVLEKHRTIILKAGNELSEFQEEMKGKGKDTVLLKGGGISLKGGSYEENKKLKKLYKASQKAKKNRSIEVDKLKGEEYMRSKGISGDTMISPENREVRGEIERTALMGKGGALSLG